jgi:arylsulfatase A-like enzyme
VLFIAVDDLKPLIGCYGSPLVRTPHLDRLGARAAIFTNNHCQQAVCGPSRASLMTGLRPDTTCVWDLKTKMRDINPDVLTIPQHFKNSGYYAVGSGKMFDGRCCDGWTSQDSISWSEPCKGVGGRRYVLDHEGKPPTEAADAPDEAYRDCQRALWGVELMRKAAAQQKPWFVGLGFALPHLPFAAPKRYWDLYDRDQFRVHPFQQRPEDAPPFAYQDSWELRGGYTGVPKKGPIPEELQLELIHGYYASVSFVDAQIGRLLDELDRLSRAEDTIVCLWGDHGWHLGDHGMWCKHTNYEQATRSPLLIAAPGLTDAGVTPEAPTEFVDIFPTLCDLTGLETPTQLEGTSLALLMRDPAAQVKTAAISQYPRGHAGSPHMGYAYRNGRYRCVRWMQEDFRAGERSGPVVARELYDYKTDPLETVNLAADPGHAEVLEWFEQRAEGGWRAFQTG